MTKNIDRVAIKTYVELVGGKKKDLKEIETFSGHPFWMFAIESPKEIKILKEGLTTTQHKITTVQAKHDEDGSYHLDKKQVSKVCGTFVNQLIFHILEEKGIRNTLKERYTRFTPLPLAKLEKMELIQGAEKEINVLNEIINVFNGLHHGDRIQNQTIQELLNKYDFGKPVSDGYNWKIYEELTDIFNKGNGDDEGKDILETENPLMKGVIETNSNEIKVKIKQPVKISYNDLRNTLDEQVTDMKTNRGGTEEEKTEIDFEEYGRSKEAEETQKRTSEKPKLDASGKVYQDDYKVPEGKTFTYDEWNYKGNFYKRNYTYIRELPINLFYSGAEHRKVNYKAVCRVVEKNSGFITQNRNILSSILTKLVFCKNRLDGDRIDLDSVIDYVIEKKKSLSPKETIYEQIERKQFDVSMLFLLDVSGSTRSFVTDSIRVIDIIAASSLILAKTCTGLLNFEIGAYSGQSHEDVRYVALKTFKEANLSTITEKILNLSSYQENRDGAIIRHGTNKLVAQSTKGKLLVLISDFVPQDENYKGKYSIEDTRVALKEATVKGVLPFGVRVYLHQFRSFTQNNAEVLFPYKNYVTIDNPEELAGGLLKLILRMVKLYRM